MPGKLSLRSLYILLFCIAFACQTQAQQQDSIATDTVHISPELPKHSPTKASLFSLVIPGLGQAYNKKYWKIPIIYGGIGVCLYFAHDQNKLFVDKRSAYRNRQDSIFTDKYTVPGNFYSDDALLKSMDNNRRNRDLMLILGAVVYFLQIADASVDAHLFYFNVSDDLTLNYQPTFQYSVLNNSAQPGLSLTLNF